MLWPDPQVSIDNALKTSAPDVPATFGDTFDTAWHEGQLFSSSVARGNAQMAGLDSYIDEVNQKSGQDIRRDVYGRLDMMNAANEAVTKIRQNRPDLQLPDLTDDELNKRAVAASSEAHQAATYMAGRDKTLGGKIGGVLGGLASGTVDPVNLVGMAVAPEAELGVLGTAAAWGGYGAGSQAVNELMNAGFRNQVEPGYIASGQPGENVVESALGGAALGGLFKVLGNTWTRMKTGEWPRSVRDAGNIVESEANIQQSNVLPGPEGEAAHREALSGTIDSILNGHGVDADTMMRSRALVSSLQPDKAFSLPVMNEQAIRLISEEADLNQRSINLGNQRQGLRFGDPAAADRLNRLEAVEQQIAGTTDRNQLKALNERRDQILVDTTPEKLGADAAPFEQRRALSAQQDAIDARLADIKKQRAAMPQQDPAMLGQTSPVKTLFDVHEGKIDALMEMRNRALGVSSAAAEQRAESLAKGELPLVASTMDIVHDFHVNSMAEGIRSLATLGAHDMPKDEAVSLAQRVARSNTPDEARAILNEVPLRPRTLADTIPSVSDVAKADRAARAELPPTLTQEDRTAAATDPKQVTAMTTDLERLRDTGRGGMIPVGVDEKGEPQYRLLDEALQDAKNDQDAAEQIEACINPPVEEAAE